MKGDDKSESGVEGEVNVRARMRLKVRVKVRMKESVQVRWVPWPLFAVQQPAWSDPETKDSKLPCPS